MDKNVAYQQFYKHSLQGKYDTSMSVMPLGQTLWQTGNQRLKPFKLVDLALIIQKMFIAKLFFIHVF